MLVAGDEVGRTQQGNNNAYCQDNEISWFDWSLVDANPDMFRFWSTLLEFRRTHAVLRAPEFYTGLSNNRGVPDLTWHGTQLSAPNWGDPDSRVLACTIGGLGDDPDLHVMMNMYWEPVSFDLMALPGRRWSRAIDTALPSPLDITGSVAAQPIDSPTYLVSERSIVVLVSGPGQALEA
jgi:isoamylase